MKPYRIFTVILTFSLILPMSRANAANSFSNLYIFGDSLSDTGNLASLPGFDFLNQPPYDRGFSNGPRAVEVLAASLGLTAEPSLYLTGLNAGTNYAVAGARARGIDVIDLRNQINAFLSGVGGSAPGQALYMVFIGGNDLRDARDENSLVNVLQIINAAVNGIDEVIRSLLESGAQSILVVNSPDISVVPETAAIAQATNQRKFVRLTRRKTQLFNHRLAQKLAQIEQDFNIDLVDFDLFSFSQSVIKNQSALGFTNALEGCFSSLTFTFDPDCDNGINFDKFVFFDEFHTTAKTNKRTGRAFYALVPEPTAKSDSLE